MLGACMPCCVQERKEETTPTNGRPVVSNHTRVRRPPIPHLGHSRSPVGSHTVEASQPSRPTPRQPPCEVGGGASYNVWKLAQCQSLKGNWGASLARPPQRHVHTPFISDACHMNTRKCTAANAHLVRLVDAALLGARGPRLEHGAPAPAPALGALAAPSPLVLNVRVHAAGAAGACVQEVNAGCGCGAAVRRRCSK